MNTKDGKMEEFYSKCEKEEDAKLMSISRTKTSFNSIEDSSTLTVEKLLSKINKRGKDFTKY